MALILVRVMLPPFSPFALLMFKLVQFLRQGASPFSLVDIQEMDSIISSFNAFETKEAGPLILTWAVFLCLISSLPKKEENNVLMVYVLFKSIYSSGLYYFIDHALI